MWQLCIIDISGLQMYFNNLNWIQNYLKNWILLILDCLFSLLSYIRGLTVILWRYENTCCAQEKKKKHLQGPKVLGFHQKYQNVCS